MSVEEQLAQINEKLELISERISVYEEDKTWYRLDEVLPEHDGIYLVYHPKMIGAQNMIPEMIASAHWYSYENRFGGRAGARVTHWRHMPEPPKGEEIDV